MAEQQERVERFTRELNEGPGASDRSIKEILDTLRPQVQELVNKQVEMARVELLPVGRQAGIAAGLLVVGAVFLLLFSFFFFLACVYFLVAFLGLPQWVSALIVSGILLVIGGALAGGGAGILLRLDPKPRRTIATLQQNIDWFKEQLRP
ncbi:MAG TPA: phage holin family protein [Rubrobacteraceae bacterium]|nr:phage holin family protein [Rubrobacteraceae bacterium]